MKKAAQPKTEDDFIAPARRAFARVAQKLRLENAVLGLPLPAATGEKSKPKSTTRTTSR
jgi:hypothetical protein